jgi:glutamate synthase (NADPH) small chain
MGELGAFLKIHRVGFDKRDPAQRVRDYKQYFELQPEAELRRQGARCMDCGIPFCHEGCPLGNLIPDWNDLVYRGKWREAIDQMHATNNFPEFTGRICPAPCESACVLAINDDPVTIEQIEMAIAERAFEEGWVVPDPPARRTGKRVAIIGSGPAGLAVAQELNRCGHSVIVYERDEGPGGMLRFGVPDAKLEKRIIDRRVDILAAEGIEFVYDTDVGRAVSAQEIRNRHDAVVVATGSRVHRDLDAPGRSLEGIHPAMDYLYQRNRWVAKQEGRPYRDPEPGREIIAASKRVIVVGGGDTGMDCVSNSHREGAQSVVMLDVYMALPESGRDPRHPWPLPPKRTHTTHALDEGRQAPLGHRGDRVRRTRRPRQPRVRAEGHRHLLAGPHPGARERVRARGRSGADRDRVLRPGAGRGGRATRSRARQAGQHPHRADLSQLDTGGVCLRRRPDRAVAGGDRDRRGAQMRPRGQP